MILPRGGPKGPPPGTERVKNDDEFRVRLKNHYASPSWPWSKMREAMLNNCLLLLFFVKK